MDSPKEMHGALHIPDNAPESSRTSGHAAFGTVLKTGEGHRRKNGSIQPLDVKPGDRIAYHRNAGERHLIEGETVLLIPEEHVLGVLE